MIMHTSLATLSYDCDIKRTCEIKKNYNPILPSTFRALGWNVGQGTLQTLLCSQLGFCVTATGDRSQPMVDYQALSRMVGIQGRNLGDP